MTSPSSPAARALADAMVPDTDQSSVRRRWGVIKAIASGSVSVDVAGVVIPGIKCLASYTPSVNERVQLDVVGTDMVVSGATAPSPRAFRRPVGDIETTLRKTPKPDTLILDGAQISRATYAELWAWAQENALITAGMFTNGNGTTTFGLPDFRNRYVTGLAAGGTAGTIVGSNSTVLTAAQLPAHKHDVAVASHATHAHGVAVAAHATHDHNVTVAAHAQHDHNVSVAAHATHDHNVTVGAHSQHSHGGGETSIDSNAHTHPFTTGTSGSHGGHASGQATVAPVNPREVSLPSSYSDAGGSHAHSGTTAGPSASHTHDFTTTTGGPTTHSVGESAAGPTTHSVTESAAGPTTHSVTEDSAGPTTHGVTESQAGPTTHGVTETVVGAGQAFDNRPESISLNWLIWV